MILNDTFTAADGSLLSAHTADSGATYGMNPAGSGVVTIDSGRSHADGAAFAYSSVSSTDCEIAAVFRCHSVDGQYAGLLGRMSTSAASWYSLLLQFGGGISLYGTSSLGTYALTFTAGTDYRVKLSLQGSLLRAFLDGFEILRATNSDHAGPGRVGFCFGAATTSSTGLHLDELEASEDFSTPQFLFDGDSLTIGEGVHTLPQADRYPTQLMDMLDNGADWANRAVSGRTLATMLSNVAQIDDCRRPNASTDIVIFWGGINDLASGGTAQDAIDRLVAYGDGRRALGFQVIALTIIAADEAHASIPSDFDAKRTTVNAWLRANWSDHFDALADVAGDERLSDPLDTTYYQTDGVHLEAEGASVVAELVAYAVESLDAVEITVTAPAAADIVLVGDSVNIEWDTTGEVDEVDILLSTDGGSTFETALAEGIANTGTFDWTPVDDHLTPAARIGIYGSIVEAAGQSAAFKVATTAAVGGGGVTPEQLSEALAELREHGDDVWGRNPILPVIARVNSDPVSRTTLIAYQQARTVHQLVIVDSTGEGVNLSGKTLQFALETLNGAGVASTAAISLYGEDSNIASFTADDTWHQTSGLFRYALRDMADGARVWARGDYVVEPTAGPAA